MPTPPNRKRKDKEQTDSRKETPINPLSAFMLYANDVRPRLETDHPNIKAVELSAKLAESWNDLNDEEKAVYHHRSEELQRKQGTDLDRKVQGHGRHKEEQKQKRKGPERPEHCIIVPNGEMKLIDSPFIQKSKRRRYELPYKYPQNSEYQPRPKPPKLNPMKRPPPPRPLIRTYPTYKERIQMMERGLYHKQAPPHIGVFKRSEDNPDLLIVDDSGQTTITFPNFEKQNGFTKSYGYGSQVSGLNGNSFFHPRIIGTGPHFAQYRLTSPPVNFIPGIYSQPYQPYRYPYLSGVHGSYVQAPQLYQQGMPIPTSHTVYSEINCSPVTTGSITVRYEPVTSDTFDNFEISDDDYLEQDPFLNIDLNDDDLQIEGDEVEFDMMGLDLEQDIQKPEDRDDLDDINPTIPPFEEGLDQYLSLDGQPYVMIPVDMDVAKKLGWPIHMLPSVPKWLSKLTDNEVTSSDVSSTDQIFENLPKLNVTPPQTQTPENRILTEISIQHETDLATEAIKSEMLRTDSSRGLLETMDCSEVSTNQNLFDIGINIHNVSEEQPAQEGSGQIHVDSQDDQLLPTATGEMMDCCGDKKADFTSTVPDERGDQRRPVLTSTPNQSPVRGMAPVITMGNGVSSFCKTTCLNLGQSPTYSPIESVCPDELRKRGKPEEETQHFKDVIRQEANFCVNSLMSINNGPATRKPSIILESLLENSDTEMEDSEAGALVSGGIRKDSKRESFMEKQSCSE